MNKELYSLINHDELEYLVHLHQQMSDLSLDKVNYQVQLNIRRQEEELFSIQCHYSEEDNHKIMIIVMNHHLHNHIIDDYMYLKSIKSRYLGKTNMVHHFICMS